MTDIKNRVKRKDNPQDVVYSTKTAAQADVREIFMDRATDKLSFKRGINDVVIITTPSQLATIEVNIVANALAIAAIPTPAVTPYLVYSALLTQLGTAAPVAIVLENTLGSVPVWSYDSVGWYPCTLVGAFPLEKTAVLLGNKWHSFSNDSVVKSDIVAIVNDVNSVWVGTRSGATLAVCNSSNDVLNLTYIEIKVYP